MTNYLLLQRYILIPQESNVQKTLILLCDLCEKSFVSFLLRVLHFLIPSFFQAAVKKLTMAGRAAICLNGLRSPSKVPKAARPL